MTESQGAAVITALDTLNNKVEALGLLAAQVHQGIIAICALTCVVIVFQIYRFRGGSG